MQKKFIALVAVFVALVAVIFILFPTEEKEKPISEILEETQARTSKGYKITDDFILINLPARVDAGVDLGGDN